MLSSEFSASTGAVIQLQLQTVSGRSTTTSDAEGNVAEDVEMLENMSVDTFVKYPSRRTLGLSELYLI